METSLLVLYYNMLVLMSAGSNARGQLANATIEDSYTFKRCSFEGSARGCLPTGTSRVLSVAGGSNHTIVLLEVNNASGRTYTEIWGSGSGEKGQLGPKISEATIFRRLHLPLKELGIENHCPKHVAATWETSYLVFSSAMPGSSHVILSMGSNDFGDLGVDLSSGLKPSFANVHIVNTNHLMRSLDDPILAVDWISSGQRHIIFYLTIFQPECPPKQIVMGWGSSRHGQLGTPDSAPSPSYIPQPRTIALSSTDSIASSSLGIHHTIFLHSSGRASTLGSNRKGQLEAAKDTVGIQQVVSTWNGTYVVKLSEDGWRVISSGSNTHGQLGRGAEETSVSFPGVDRLHTSIVLAAGSEHLLALISDVNHSELWAWGWNEHGNLGMGHTADVRAPTPVRFQDGGRIFVCAMWGGCGTSWLSCEVDDAYGLR